MTSQHTPPAQWLRTFLSVAHGGCFSEAAERLHITQAAVSKHMRQLEHSYGVPLFKRHARGVELSEAGKALYPKVEQAFELLAQAGDALHIDSKRQRVRLRSDATWAEAVLAPHFADFCQRHNDIQLVLNSYIWADENNRHGTDLHIAFSDGELAGFEGQRLSTEHSFVVCSPELKAKLECADRVARDQVTKLVLMDHESLWARWEQSSERTYNVPSVDQRLFHCMQTSRRCWSRIVDAKTLISAARTSDRQLAQTRRHQARLQRNLLPVQTIWPRT